jgi:peptidoglycan/LPS O-acetylase OafA/YrhL
MGVSFDVVPAQLFCRAITPSQVKGQKQESRGLQEEAVVGYWAMAETQAIVQPPPNSILRPVMPELDAVRGIAILGVLFYHLLYLGVDLSRFPHVLRILLTGMWTGRLGVSLFFVLSGFLITGILLDSRGRQDYYRRFDIRRVLRIMPAYLLTIGILFALGYSRNFLLLSLLYMTNVAPLFGVGITYPVLWSLAVEEHFYFVWPWLTRVLRPRGLALLAIAIVGLSPVSRWLSFPASVHDGLSRYIFHDYTWNSADGLACGALLAIFLREYKPSRAQLARIVAVLLSISGLIWIIGLPFGILSRQTQFGAAAQVVPWNLLFTAMVLVFLLTGTSSGKALVQIPLLIFYGDISYGLYLYHPLLIRGFDVLNKHGHLGSLGDRPLLYLAVRFVTVLAVATLVAYVSRRQFEDRFLKLKSRLT